MSLSGALRYFGDTSNIDKRYNKKSKDLLSIGTMNSDLLGISDRIGQKSIEKDKIIDYALEQGYEYSEDNNEFMIDGRKVSYPTFKAVKPFLEMGIFDKSDFSNPLLSESEGEDNIKTIIDGEPQLINEEEQNLIDVAGDVGKKLISETSYGNVDEETGLIKNQGGIGIADKFMTGLNTANKTLSKFSPSLSLFNMVANEYGQAKINAQRNLAKINQLEEGIGVIRNKSANLQNEFNKNMLNLEKDTISGFQDFSTSAASAIDSANVNVNKMLKTGKGLKTSAPSSLLNNLTKTIEDQNKLMSTRSFDKLDRNIDKLSKNVRDTVEDIGFSTRKMNYEIDTLKKSDSVLENIFGGIFS